jgi:hypothetical protein
MRNESFEIGQKVKFEIKGTDIRGTGEILGRATRGALLEAWIVLIKERNSEYMKSIPEKAVVINDTDIYPI